MWPLIYAPILLLGLGQLTNKLVITDVGAILYMIEFTSEIVGNKSIMLI